MKDILCRINYISGETKTVTAKKSPFRCGYSKHGVSLSDWSDVESVDFGYSLADAYVGDEGYYVYPQTNHTKESHICRFTERDDNLYVSRASGLYLPVFGVKHEGNSFAAFIDGDIEYAAKLVIGVKDGKYYLYPKFMIDGESPSGEVAVYYRELDFEDADYSRIASLYRTYLLESGICIPLSKRHTDSLDYAKGALYVRIRQAWKPVPSPVEEQTDENEPPIHVACNYASVKRLIGECKRRGVDKADFCLVGWNVGGHDGRWPQTFPTEPSLGSEEELRELIAYAKSLGFTISCHTNSTDAYSIADCYSDCDIVTKKDGSPSYLSTIYSGGKPRNLCAVVGYKQAKETLPKVRELGFNGVHYIDVVSITQPERCYNQDHPLSIPEAQEYRRRMGDLSRKLFGGFASEGARSFCMPVLDHALYVTFRDPKNQPEGFADEYVPLWELIYHGISLYNSYSATINPTIKDDGVWLICLERGVRPSFYYYSKFMSEGTNSMGDVDMRCDTEEALDSGISAMKTALDAYKEISYLQEKYMLHHEKRDGIAKVTYSDGSLMTVDYNEKSATLTRGSKLIWSYVSK